MRAVIYHNPRCSKSRQTLALLEERGVELEIVRYLEEPPSAERLAALCDGLGCRPVEMMRTREARFAELGLAPTDEREPAEWFALMAANPVLIERPIVECDGRVAMGRPPENVLAIL